MDVGKICSNLADHITNMDRIESDYIWHCFSPLHSLSDSWAYVLLTYITCITIVGQLSGQVQFTWEYIPFRRKGDTKANRSTIS